MKPRILKYRQNLFHFCIVKAGQLACKAAELSSQWWDTVHITGDGSKVLLSGCGISSTAGVMVMWDFVSVQGVVCGDDIATSRSGYS